MKQIQNNLISQIHDSTLLNRRQNCYFVNLICRISKAFFLIKCSARLGYFFKLIFYVPEIDELSVKKFRKIFKQGPTKAENFLLHFSLWHGEWRGMHGLHGLHSSSAKMQNCTKDIGTDAPPVPL